MSGKRRRLKRFRWALVAGTLSAVAALAINLAYGSDRLLDAIWWVVACVFATVGANAAQRWREAAAAAGTIFETKRKLADLVKERATNERAMLGMDPLIPVEWREARASGHGTPALEFDANDIGALATYYRNLKPHRRRMVITGASGMGKTSLAVELTLKLIDCRGDDEPVPIVLRVTDWDLERYESLQDWLVNQLRTHFDEGDVLAADDAARTLARNRHLLPILDNFEEVPENTRVKLLKQLAKGRKTDGQQVIIVSWPQEYEDAARRANFHAPVITAKSLEPEAAADYLDNFELPTEWDEVLSALRAGSAKGLSELAATPWGLWQIRAIYIDTDTDPRPLVTQYGDDARALRAHLLESVVDALLYRETLMHSHRRMRRTYRAAKVHTWLGRIASLTDTSTPGSIAWWSIVDTAAHPRVDRRWSLPGLSARICIALAYGLPVAVVASLIRGPLFGVTLGLVFGGASASNLSHQPELTPIRDRLRRTSSHWLREFGVVLRLAVVAGAITIPIAIITVGLLAGFGVAVAYFFSVYVGIRNQDPKRGTEPVQETSAPSFGGSATPQSSWRASRTVVGTHILLGVVVGLVGVLLAELVFSVGVDPSPRWEIFMGLLIGTMFVVLQRQLSGSWLLSVATLVFLPRSRRLPLRLMDFLDNMHRLGILRMSGSNYEFRHAELYHHLAKTSHDELGPRQPAADAKH